MNPILARSQGKRYFNLSTYYPQAYIALTQGETLSLLPVSHWDCLGQYQRDARVRCSVTSAAHQTAKRANADPLNSLGPALVADFVVSRAGEAYDE